MHVVWLRLRGAKSYPNSSNHTNVHIEERPPYSAERPRNILYELGTRAAEEDGI